MTTRTPQSRQRGFTLVEMMVGIVIGLVVFAGVSGLFVSTLGASSTKIAVQRADQTLRTLGDFMASEIRRANYTAPGQLLRMPFSPQSGTASCMTFFRSDSVATIDPSGGVTIGPSADAYYGFALANNGIFMAKVVQPSTNAAVPISCAAFSASAANWTLLTSPSAFKVTDFSVDASAYPLVKVRIAGEVVGQRQTNGAALARVVEFSVKLRNLGTP